VFIVVYAYWEDKKLSMRILLKKEGICR